MEDKIERVFPEEDKELEELPKETLLIELAKRMGITEARSTKDGKIIDFSAVSDKQLLHHIALRMNSVSHVAGESLLQEAVVLEQPDMTKPAKRNRPPSMA